MMEKGELAGAGLDVFEHEPAVNPSLLKLARAGKVVLLPHMGSATIEGRIDMGEKVIINIKTFMDGHKPPDRVLPSMLVAGVRFRSSSAQRAGTDGCYVRARRIRILGEIGCDATNCLRGLHPPVPAIAAGFAAGRARAGKDIQSTFFTGQPFTASTPSNIQYKMMFMADGKMTREPVGKTGVKGEGTWKLDKDGFCTTWKGCRPIASRGRSGDNKWSVMRGTT